MFFDNKIIAFKKPIYVNKPNEPASKSSRTEMLIARLSLLLFSNDKKEVLPTPTRKKELLYNTGTKSPKLLNQPERGTEHVGCGRMKMIVCF